jgi:tetratricopeptide (TPR) repeat protein
MMPIKINHLIIAIITTAISTGTIADFTHAQPHQQIALEQANYAKLYLIGGRKKWNEDKYQEAIELFDKAISADPENADAHFWKGMSHDGLNQSDLAISSLDRAIALDKEYGLAYYMRGMNYSTKKKYDLAINDLEVASKLLKTSGNNVYAERALQTIVLLKTLK